MLCTNCGEDVPMAGKVCPWCGHSKAADASWTMASYVAVGAAVVGYFIAGFAGALGGFAAGWAGYMLLPRLKGRISPSNPAQASPPSLSSEPVADKLAQLKQLHDQGLISADEFATKKAELLSRI